MFRSQEDMAERLDGFNRRWQSRHRCLAQHYGGGWWGMGSVVDADMRGRYNAFMPMEDYERDLKRVALDFLQDDDLLPNALRKQTYLSLPDWWAVLEEPFGGRVCYDYQELLPLLCNVAEPSRMGTAVGRYPEQLSRVRELCTGKKRLRLLDLGCGVGLGTYELAACALEVCGDVQITGVTAEGLEVWMATGRCLPHDARREAQFHSFGPLPVTFVKGLAQSYDDGSIYDIIVCNGLAGGRYLQDEQELRRFLASCRKALGGHGCLCLSNRFHEGFRPGVEALCQLAETSGWVVKGKWQALELRLI